jgi:tRNA (cmo5U34)-methyltransferase
MTAPTGTRPEGLERMRAAYARDVAILPPGRVETIIESAGFEPPVEFFQAGLIHAWFSRRASD